MTAANLRGLDAVFVFAIRLRSAIENKSTSLRFSRASQRSFQPQYVEGLALMAYGPSLLDASRHAAVYVDKILKGAKAAELPVEQPREYRLVVNLRTARTLGLNIPSSIVMRADEVIR
jgi:hypothetical protein